MVKNKKFKLPYIGVDKKDENINILYGEKGEATVVLKIINNVLQYSANPDYYLEFHNAFSNVIKIIGEDHFIQKLDVFSKKTFSENISEEYLQKKYDSHFDGRAYKSIDTFIAITRKARKKHSKKEDEEFKQKINKVVQLLSASGFSPKLLFEKEINDLIRRTLVMDFSSKFVHLDNMQPSDYNIKIDGKLIKCLSLIDIDNCDLPSTVTPYIEINEDALKNFPVDRMGFLNKVGDYETLIYNQVIEIPSQMKTLRQLEVKKKRHSGMPDPANDLCVEDIDALLNDVARESQLIVNAHFNIVICAKEEEVTKALNSIETHLFNQNVIASKRSFNQMELFRTVLAGNSVELKDYDWFMTTSDASLCFFFKEALPVSEPSNFYLRFTDRQGIPLKVDPSDYPMEIGRIVNRNKFVLGPSGSGKSFVMNNIIEQYLLYNMDVVIVDTGDSYSGLSSYYNGKYITYTAEKPITMNPFIMKKEEYNLEKKEFLQTLISLLWKGADGKITSIETDVLAEVITAYYATYFNNSIDKDSLSISELEEYLQDRGINVTLLLEESKLAVFGDKNLNHYDILGISEKATQEELKRAYRLKAIEYHPDKNPNLKDASSIFSSIAEAYNVILNRMILRDENSKNTSVVLKEEDKESDLDNNVIVIYKSKLLQKFDEVEEKGSVKELSFNSFYEFALYKIPLVTSKEKIPFEIDEFRYILKKFYRGGEFETILNENSDSSLFDERLIIFEIDNIKEHKILFPIVTLIIMDVFIQKMRLRKTQRKALIIEEAWKAIASPMMAGYILYLYKTVRKFWGEAIVVTQELGDIIGNPVVKDSIINNSDSLLLLDQTKFKDNFAEIANLLSLNTVEQKKIFTINNLDNRANRSRFKEFYFKRGDRGEVYGNEVSLAQYLTYTTEKPEKMAVEFYTSAYGSYPKGLDAFIESLEVSKLSLPNLVNFVNLYGKPIPLDILLKIKSLEEEHKQNTFNYIKRILKNQDINFEQYINQLNKVA